VNKNMAYLVKQKSIYDKYITVFSTENLEQIIETAKIGFARGTLQYLRIEQNP
jgi:hypothetical protein